MKLSRRGGSPNGYEDGQSDWGFALLEMSRRWNLFIALGSDGSDGSCDSKWLIIRPRLNIGCRLLACLLACFHSSSSLLSTYISTDFVLVRYTAAVGEVDMMTLR
jgi:hypothetical protein